MGPRFIKTQILTILFLISFQDFDRVPIKRRNLEMNKFISISHHAWGEKKDVHRPKIIFFIKRIECVTARVITGHNKLYEIKCNIICI